MSLAGFAHFGMGLYFWYFLNSHNRNSYVECKLKHKQGSQSSKIKLWWTVCLTVCRIIFSWASDSWSVLVPWSRKTVFSRGLLWWIIFKGHWFGFINFKVIWAQRMNLRAAVAVQWWTLRGEAEPICSLPWCLAAFALLMLLQFQYFHFCLCILYSHFSSSNVHF